MAKGIIEQIKEKLDILTEIGSIVELRRSGKAYKGRCPFHQERTPSFYVFPETGTWRCFGCNEGGDIFTFFEKQNSLTFGETLNFLAEKAGIETGNFFDSETAESSTQTTLRTRLKSMNESASIWFHHQLLTASQAAYARAYLQSRGINNESIERFRLGYAPEGDNLSQYLLSQEYTEEEILEAGFTRRREAEKGGTIYDYFRNRVIFPIRDTRDQVIGFGGRELGGGQPKYLNSPQTPLFDKSNTLYALDLARETIRRQDQIIIVEGYVDALIAHQYGYKNTVACIGSAITARHVQQIKKLTRRMILALDPDTAGEMATLRAIEVAQEGFDRTMIPIPMPASNENRSGATSEEKPRKKKRDSVPQGMIRFEEQVDADIRVLKLPMGIDPDEFIRQDPSAWEQAVKTALPLVDFYFDVLLNDLDLHSPSGQTEATKRLIPILAAIGDRIKQDAYVRQLANLLHIDERNIQRELQRHRKYHSSNVMRKEGEQEKHPILGEKYQISGPLESSKDSVNSLLGERLSAAMALEQHCISLLLRYPETLFDIYVILELSDFWGTETRALYSTLTSAKAPLTPATVDALLTTLPETLQSVAEQLRLRATAEPRLDRSQLARTAMQIAYRLKRFRLTEAITDISYLEREATTQNDLETSQMLREKIRTLLQQRSLLDSANVLQT
jgi:DNA primase